MTQYNEETFGPIQGNLRHNPSLNYIKTEYINNTNLKDFTVSASFVNPYSAKEHEWDFGFIFRHQNGSNRKFHIVINSDKEWFLESTDATGIPELINTGTSGNLNTGEDGRNELSMIAIGYEGLLFVNGGFVSMLDLSTHTEEGGIAAATGFYSGREKHGAVTKFVNLRGNALTHEYEMQRYFPNGVKLESIEGYVSSHDSDVHERNFIAEAEFRNPNENHWSYGFAFRHSEINRLEIAGIALAKENDAPRWFHKTRKPRDDRYTDMDDGNLLPESVRKTNRLLLIAINKAGYFFLNGNLTARLDLSHNMDHGSISAIGGFFGSDTSEPELKDFNVWIIPD